MPFFDQDIFETALERYGTWPITVWEIRDHDPQDRKLKASLGDLGLTRPPDPRKHSYKIHFKGNKQGTTVSIFPPRIAANILSLYAKRSGVVNVYDPFAGGGCRAVMAAKAGFDYTGVELRQDEVDNINALAERHGVSDRINIICGDSRQRAKELKNQSFDFCYTCPPYWNLELYKGGPNDLSMIASYDDFCDALWYSIQQCHRVLKPGSISCWVVGLHRDKNGGIAPLNHDIARLHRDLGFRFREEVVIFRNNGAPLLRVGNFEKANRFLVRVHEYCLVFDRL